MAILWQLFKHATAGSYKGSPTKWSPEMGSFYTAALKAKDIDGKEVSMKDYAGKVALVTNVASYWGATKSSYEAMVRLYGKYKDRGFTVLAFPCNQFGAQEPKSEAEIKQFVAKRGVTFPMFSKVNVNGETTHPIYKFLKQCFPGDITWNFAAKFIIDHQGIPIARYGKSSSPGESWDDIETTIVTMLDDKDKAAAEAAAKGGGGAGAAAAKPAEAKM